LRPEFGPFPSWFDARFDRVLREFEGKRFEQDASDREHDEALSLRKSRNRYRDTLGLIRGELERPGTSSFLDVGGGHMAWFAAERFPGRTFAADLSGLYAREAAALGVETRRWDVTTDDCPFPAASFDIVAFTEVLEHLPPPPFPYVKRVVRLLKPGGTLLFSCPNMAAFMKRVKFALFGRSPLKLGSARYVASGYPEHIREYTYREAQQILVACGLAIERVRTGDYGFGVWRRVTTRLHGVLPSLGRTTMIRARLPLPPA